MLRNATQLIFVLLLWVKASNAELVTYYAPVPQVISHDYKVMVKERGSAVHRSPVYWAEIGAVTDTKIVPKRSSFTSFDCSGTVEVRVLVKNQAIRQVRIRPLSYHIVPVVDGAEIKFTMHSGQYLSLEVNGNVFENLQIFANEIEPDPVKFDDPDLIYFGPGLHKIGKMSISSNKTVYLAGGSIVIGSLYLSHAQNIKIRGRGILTQRAIAPEDDPAIQRSDNNRNDEITIQQCKNVSVSGIVIMPHKYSVLIGESHNITLKDLKSFSSEGNADGIDVFCSDNIEMSHLYMRNSDDCIAIYGHRWQYYGNVNAITVQNSILWADVAHPILVGTHGDSVNPDTIQNLRFKNITVLDHHENQLDYQGCIALNAGDSNLIRNCSFEDFNIEDFRKGQLINLRVMFNRKYNSSPGAGIQDILFKNLTYSGQNAGTSIIAGYDDKRQIKNISFKNLIINGRCITDKMKGKPGFYKTGDMANFFIGEHVDNILFNEKD